MLYHPPQSLARPLLSSRNYVCQSCLRRAFKAEQCSYPITPIPHVRRYLASTASQDPVVPFRKQLKDEARKRRAEGAPKSSKKKLKGTDPRLEKWELTVGIEIHAELNTAKKLFSSAATSVNDAPNTHAALFDLAFPGTQPQFQKETLLPALRAALALNCSIQRRSTFDRKHYFYQDQPAGYQITQYYEPFAKDGYLTVYDHDGIAPEDGRSITIGIKQIQMEQDTAKTLLQPPSTYLLDFNRVSHPLIEIITLPHIHHPSTAAACVRKIQAILKSVNAVTAGMEIGGLRADVNVSVRERHGADSGNAANSYYGVTGLGQRTEIKNLSSFKFVEDAIIAERDRQISILEAGGAIEGETRGWAIGSTGTRKLRGKEGEVDYRYMPDPDLGPVLVGEDLLQHLRFTLPPLPDQTLAILTDSTRYNLTTKDAKTLLAMDDGDRVEYFMEVVSLLQKEFPEEIPLPQLAKTAGNWLLHELTGHLTTALTPWGSNPIPPKTLSAILTPLLRNVITRRTAKSLLAHFFSHLSESRTVDQIIEDENLALVPMSDVEYEELAQKVVAQNPDMVRQVMESAGKGPGREKGKVMWLVGQMVRTGEEGRVQAERAELWVRRVLELVERV